MLSIMGNTIDCKIPHLIIYIVHCVVPINDSKEFLEVPWKRRKKKRKAMRKQPDERWSEPLETLDLRSNLYI